jgi:hypothetical protein
VTASVRGVMKLSDTIRLALKSKDENRVLSVSLGKWNYEVEW